MTTPVDDEATSWGEPTHYEFTGVPIEPRMFTEADPMTSVLPQDWETRAEQDVWSAPTYVGRGHYRRAIERARAGERLGPDDLIGGEHAEAPSAAVQDSGTVPATGTAEATPARGLLANSRSMAVASLVSRITGFVRSVMIVAALGFGGVADSYNSGNNFPNMVYELLLGGVLSSVLVPLLVRAQLEDHDEGVGYTQRLLSIATAALGALTLLAVLAAPLIAGAFSKPDTRELTTLFATLLLPEIFFYGLGAMFMAVLNIRHSYAPGAWSPVLNNIVMIVTVVVFWALPGPDTLNPHSITTPQILVLGIGTTVGIAAQALVLIPALRGTGFRWRWRFRALPHETGRLGEVGVLAGWVIGYVVVSQVGVSVIQHVGTANGGFTVFTNADLLFQMPYGILVVSLLTAIMPRLSRAAATNRTGELLNDLSLAARLSALGLLPVTALLIVLGGPLGVTLFAHGSAATSEALLTGHALAWSAFGLFPFALVMLQLRVFYAMRDGRTPTLINVGMVGVKVVLVVLTDQLYDSAHRSTAIQWLNIATSASYVVGAVIGHILLTRRLGRLGFGSVLRTSLQIGAASAAGAAVAWAIARLAHAQWGTGHLSSLVGLVGGGVLGLVVIVGVAWQLRLPEVRDAVARLRR